MADAFLGIDLGTTNSVAAVSDGDRITPVRLPEGGTLLPSVVRIDARANVTVGARARRFLETDPENTRGEFKRLMGSERRVSFRAAKLEKTPEELSALVLGALRAAAEQALGHTPSAAVVTVPALFELPQTRATSEAARLAGFERVEHLQEPVASALRAGWKRDEDRAPWLVYDLGGGTFDVSLLETREGVLRVVDHDGDNFLGGRDMDARLLDHVLARLAETSGKRLQRADPAAAGVVRRLRAACEETKMELGARRDATVALADPILVGGEEILVDVPIDVKTFEELVVPLVDRTIDVCLRLLERQGFAPNGIGRIVLVGGPTVMPVLRGRLESRLGIALTSDVDPMTAVAEGAALFAAEHRVATTTAPAKSEKPADPKAERVWLQYPGVSGDLFPFLVGRFAGDRVKSVRAVREGYASAEEKVDGDGSFVLQLSLEPRTVTTFRLEAFDEAHEAVAIEPREVTLRHGLSLADPPLSRTIGVALADGTVAVYFERGAPLPSRKTFSLHTTLTVHPNQAESAVSVPIVQGEVDVAHLCRLVGKIEIPASGLKAVLTAGSPVEVVLELDRGGKLAATAHIPSQKLTFPGTLVLVSPDAPIAELDERLAELRKKTETYYADRTTSAEARKKLVRIDARLDEAAREAEAARGGDADALEKLRRLLIDADGELAEVEAERTWPELERDGLEKIAWAASWIAQTGTEMDRKTLDEAVRSLERARAARNAPEYARRLRTIMRLGNAAVVRDPGVVRRWFEESSGRLGEMRDPKSAKQLVERGNAAIARSDHDELRRVAHALAELLPPPEEVRAKAHGSGVSR